MSSASEEIEEHIQTRHRSRLVTLRRELRWLEQQSLWNKAFTAHLRLVDHHFFWALLPGLADSRRDRMLMALAKRWQSVLRVYESRLTPLRIAMGYQALGQIWWMRGFNYDAAALEAFERAASLIKSVTPYDKIRWWELDMRGSILIRQGHDQKGLPLFEKRNSLLKKVVATIDQIEP